jgi:hypothetical protein
MSSSAFRRSTAWRMAPSSFALAISVFVARRGVDELLAEDARF